MTVEVVQSRFWATNTGIITAPDHSIVLVDPGVFPDELAALALRAGEGRLHAALSTHEDWDHVLWSTGFPAGVSRLAHPATVRILDQARDQLLASLSAAETDFGVAWDHALVGRLQASGERLTLDNGIRLTIVPTPGHTPGHTSLWLDDEAVLFAGDMLSDVDIPMLMPHPEAARTYLASLDVLTRMIAFATTVVPGHGTPCDHVEAHHRYMRDRAYIDALLAWASDPGNDHPSLETLLPGDLRAGRRDNVAANWQNLSILRH